MSTRATILVIDDELGMREMLSYELSLENFEVVTVENGSAGIEELKSRKFDLAITDFKMPGIDGAETVELLKSIDPDIEVIVATGYATVESAVTCLKNGAYDFIQKPYDLDELKLLIERALQKRNLSGTVALYEMSRELLIKLNHFDIINMVLDIAGKATNCDEGALIIKCKAKNSATEKIYRFNAMQSPSDSLLSTLTASATDAKEPIRIPSATHDSIPGKGEADGYISALVFPLETRGHALGSLVLLRKEGSVVFTHSDLQKGSVLANQLALSLDNAFLHEELEEKCNELQILNDSLKLKTEQIQKAAVERMKTEERFRHLATHDSLTNLPNRVLLHDRLTQAIARARRSKNYVAFLLLDLDRFKEINDTLGHDTGDILLQETAKVLSRSVRECDTVARMGGDEFIVILVDLNTPNDSAFITQRILNAFTAPFLIANREIHVAPSIGMSLFPDDGEDIETLLKDADIAMYMSKGSGGNTFTQFSTSMNKDAEEKMLMTNALRKAVERNELQLHYQPLIDLNTSRIAGIEALLRWQRSEDEFISPLTFIPIAESTGLIVPIGEWVLRTACKQNARWQQEGFPPVPIAVNISARQLHQKNLVSLVLEILEENNLAPENLILEITETTAMENADESIKILNSLYQMGIKIFIDDFGSGYSSIGRLKNLPVHALKIDPFFTQHIVDDPDDAAIVMSIMAMAHSLNIKVIAEGVETEAQLEKLQTLEWSNENTFCCDQIQGYFFSRPVPAEEFTSLFINQQTYGKLIPAVTEKCGQ